MHLAFAGGVGGAKLALGLSNTLTPDDMTVVVNTGDDFNHLGLHICPDLDTVMYTMAGIANNETGWGLAGETWNFIDALESLGGETWFRLGDRDIATHIERTRRLNDGETLSEVTAAFTARLGIRHRILPMTDEAVRTIVNTTDGALPFQEYFVKRRFEPVVTGFDFPGAANAAPAPAISELFDSGSVESIIICPSNPYVSIAPIIAVPALREYIAGSAVPVIAISPIVGGQAIKGPAAKMMNELGKSPSVRSVAEHYRGLATAMVIDTVDGAEADYVRSLGMDVAVTNTIMNTGGDKTALAREVIAFADRLPRPS